MIGDTKGEGANIAPQTLINTGGNGPKKGLNITCIDDWPESGVRISITMRFDLRPSRDAETIQKHMREGLFGLRERAGEWAIRRRIEYLERSGEGIYELGLLRDAIEEKGGLEDQPWMRQDLSVNHNRRITLGDTGSMDDRFMQKEKEKLYHKGLPQKVSLKTCSRERVEGRLAYLEGLLAGGKKKVYGEVLRLREELRSSPQ